MAGDERLELLRQLGLSEHQAKVYDALVSLGRATPRETSERSGLARPRVYSVLAALAERGLAVADGDAFRPAPLAPILEARAEEAAKRRATLAARRGVLAREFEPARAEGDEPRLARGVRANDVLAEALERATRRVDASFSIASLAHALDAPRVGEALRDALERLPASHVVVHARAADARRLAERPPALLRAARVAPADEWRFDRVVVDRELVVLRFPASSADSAGASLDVALSARHAGLAEDAAAVVAEAWSRGRLALALIANERAASAKSREGLA